MRELIPVVAAAAFVLAAPAGATLSPALRAQKAHRQRVLSQIAAINSRLERVVQAWDGANVELIAVQRDLRSNESRLRLARANLHAAQLRLEQRLVGLYVSPNPTTLDVLAGAQSISDLIDRLETSQVLSRQDSAIALQTRAYEHAVTRHENALRNERRLQAAAVARLAARRHTITAGINEQYRLLASIHQTIQRIEMEQAARERRLAIAAQARIKRQVALAQQRAATEALAAPTPLPAAPSAPDTDAVSGPAASNTSQAPTPASAPTPTPAPVLAAPTGAGHPEAASIAARYLGIPYAWGGESPTGFDCSGLVSYVYAQLGIPLPHYTVAQWNATTAISTAELAPGDLVFFDGLSHVGIYIGDGQFIHAPHTGTVVQIGTLSGYWAAHLDGARRVP